MGNRGINMTLKHISDGNSVFTFCRDLRYETIEQDFQACKNSMDPRAIMMFQHHNPFHAGGNLQMAEIHLHRGEFKIAADLIERAVYTYECGYHPKFNPLAENRRLHNQRNEDDEFFRALRRHIQCLARRGCVRAALETCKYALSLQPEADPLCLLSYIGFYAIRAKQYAWLTKFVNLFNKYPIPARYFPNLRFATALALLQMNRSTRKPPDKDDTPDKKRNGGADKATEALEAAVYLFPTVVHSLVTAVDAKILKQDTRWKFLQKANGSSGSAFVDKIAKIFAARSAVLWRGQEELDWLRTTASRVLSWGTWLFNTHTHHIHTHKECIHAKARGGEA
uniref:Uncharacterized protein n=1 Tax=Lotharella globosa TaxID=91324 RepID=A0A7S3YQ05_9EUKA